VWNGESPQSGTPGRRSHFSPRLSSSSLSQAASAVSAAVEHGKQLGKHFIDDGKQFIDERINRHHRVPSINTDDAEKSSAIDSLTDARDQSSNHTSRHNSSSSAKTEPRVLHGWTLTSEVGFREVCATIRETAFITTNLPIIVSLEVHADLEQQEIMVQIMKEEWKGLLVDEPQGSCDPEERLPRLDELLNKVSLPHYDRRRLTSTDPSQSKKGYSFDPDFRGDILNAKVEQ
jgi:phosphatidylinositol phospholipase C, delta